MLVWQGSVGAGSGGGGGGLLLRRRHLLALQRWPLAALTGGLAALAPRLLWLAGCWVAAPLLVWTMAQLAGGPWQSLECVAVAGESESTMGTARGWPLFFREGPDPRR